MSAITLEKMNRVIQGMRARGINNRALIHSDGSGEIKISPTSQPTRAAHDYLLAKGFVLHDTVYIYRPK